MTNDAAEGGVKHAQEVKASASSASNRKKIMIIKNEHSSKYDKLHKKGLKSTNA